MLLALQLHFDNVWRQAATPELREDAAGHQGASIVNDELGYFIAFAGVIAVPYPHDTRGIMSPLERFQLQ